MSNLNLKRCVQGAVFWDWTTVGIDKSSDVPVQLQRDPALFAAAVEEKGVSLERPVVVYDDGGASMLACRVRWALRAHGHPEVSVLRGGWRAWTDGNRESELYEPCPLKVRLWLAEQEGGSGLRRKTCTRSVQSSVEQPRAQSTW